MRGAEMKRLSKTLYYVKKGHPDAPDQTRMWHDCPVRGMRVELLPTGQTEDTINFDCPRCDFTYALDKYLTLA